MKEMVGQARENGYNVVVMNHYAPKDETDLRLLNLTNNKYLDEVVEFALK